MIRHDPYKSLSGILIASELLSWFTGLCITLWVIQRYSNFTWPRSPYKFWRWVSESPLFLFLHKKVWVSSWDFSAQAFSQECVTEKYISYFSTKTYVVGDQKNRLNEMVLLSTQNICYKLWVRKYFQFYAENICLSKPMALTASAGSHFLNLHEKLSRGT